MQKAFVVDFDGTITSLDVGFSIIKNLADKGWEEVGEQWIQRKISTSECGKKQWDLIKKDDSDIKKFVKGFSINPGFREFVYKLREEGAKLIVASDGYDIYINEILKENGFSDIKVYCNKAVYKDGWNLSFLNDKKYCKFCGNCKKNIVDELKNDGYEVYYVGDGYSDRCACLHSDIVFAKSFLKDYCEKQRIPHYSFNDFFDVLRYI